MQPADYDFSALDRLKINKKGFGFISFIIVAVGFVASTIYMVYVGNMPSHSEDLTPAKIFGVVSLIVLIWMAIIMPKAAKKRRLIMEQFAAQNKLKYTELIKGVPDNEPGTLFTYGLKRSQRSSDVLEGVCNDMPYRQFRYQYLVPNVGKYQYATRVDLISLTLKHSLPTFVIHPKAFLDSESALPPKFENNQKIAIDPEFDTVFTVFAPVQSQAAVAAYFSPQLRGILLSNGTGCDIESVAGKVYFYWRAGPSNNRMGFEKMFATIADIMPVMLSQPVHHSGIAQASARVEVSASTADQLVQKSNFRKYPIRWIFLIFVLSIPFILALINALTSSN